MKKINIISNLVIYIIRVSINILSPILKIIPPLREVDCSSWRIIYKKKVEEVEGQVLEMNQQKTYLLMNEHTIYNICDKIGEEFSKTFQY